MRVKARGSAASLLEAERNVNSGAHRPQGCEAQCSAPTSRIVKLGGPDPERELAEKIKVLQERGLSYGSALRKVLFSDDDLARRLSKADRNERLRNNGI